MLKKIRNYYPDYLLAHQNKWNRRLHVLGNLCTLLFLAGSIKLLLAGHIIAILLLMASPFVVYPFAWLGHLVFEKNEPATWSVSPLLTKSCDWLMMKDMLLGRLER